MAKKPKAKVGLPGHPKKVPKGTKGPSKAPLSPSKRNLADPGLRSKIPTNKLPAKYKAMRLANQTNKLPIAPGSSYTFGQLKRDRSAAEALEFGPKESELKSALQQSQGRTKTIGSWFDSYKNDIAQAQANAANIYNQTIAEMGARAQQSQVQAQQDRSQIDSQRMADAAQRGMTYNAASSVDDAQAAASRKAIQDAFMNATAQAGAASQNYYGGRNVVAGAARLGELGKESEYQKGIEGKSQELARLKGAFRTDYESKARQREQEYGLAAGALGVKQQTARAGIQDQRGKRQIAREKVRVDAKLKRIDQELKRADLTEKRRANLEKERIARVKALNGIRTGTTKWTDVQLRDHNNQFLKGLNMIRSEPPAGKSPSQIVGVLNSQGVNSELAQVLVDWYRGKGKISPQSAKVLDKFGVPFKRSRIRKK